MRNRRNRLGLWIFILVILAAGIIYLYYNKNSTLIGGTDDRGEKPQSLVYLKESKNGQQIIKRSLTNDSEQVILDNFGELLFLSQEIDKGVALTLIKNGDKYILYTLGLKSGSQTLLQDLSKLKPRAVYEIGQDDYVAVSGEKGEKLTRLSDEDFNLSVNGEITAVYSPSENRIQVAIFDGNESVINEYKGENKTKEIAKTNGKVYSFDSDKILYAQKTTTTQDENSPLGKTIWKIAIKEVASQNETVVSDGNFDQDAVASSDLSYIAYQKKYDLNDQPDGKIMIITPDSKNDRLTSGIPLIFSYE
jgi:hypothetical protein